MGYEKMMKTTKRLISVLCICMLCFGLVACGNNAATTGDPSNTVVRVGSKNFTENFILAEIFAIALEDAGITVERNFGLSSAVIHTAITSDEVDLYPEYTGTGLLAVLGLPLETDPQKVYDIVKQQYLEQFNIVWLDYAQASNSQALVVTRRISEELGITTISDLQAHATSIRFASQGEFDHREDGIPLLTEVYGPFDWASTRVIDNALKYEVLRNDEADAAPAYSTEGQLLSEDFVLLKDDLQAWPPYNIAPIIRQQTLDIFPEIADILNRIMAVLDNETMIQLNARVDVDQEEYAAVARDFFNSLAR